MAGAVRLPAAVAAHGDRSRQQKACPTELARQPAALCLLVLRRCGPPLSHLAIVASQSAMTSRGQEANDGQGRQRRGKERRRALVLGRAARPAQRGVHLPVVRIVLRARLGLGARPGAPHGDGDAGGDGRGHPLGARRLPPIAACRRLVARGLLRGGGEDRRRARRRGEDRGPVGRHARAQVGAEGRRRRHLPRRGALDDKARRLRPRAQPRRARGLGAPPAATGSRRPPRRRAGAPQRWPEPQRRRHRDDGIARRALSRPGLRALL